jgi:adenosylcobinamide-GDP ribazoletransferase
MEHGSGGAVTTTARRSFLDAARGEPLAAIALLTRLPVASRDGIGRAGSADRTGAAAFGLVGIALGAIAAIPVMLVGAALPLLAAALGFVAIVIATGVLHLDGLADTADALAAPDPRAAERARVDPRIGAAGAAAIVGVLSVEGAAVAGLIEVAGPPAAALSLVLAGSASRATAVVVGWFTARDADGAEREEGPGFGAWFAARVRPQDVVVAVASAVLVAGACAVGGYAGVAIAAGIGAAIGLALSIAVVRVRGGLDGDALGATIELTFAAVVVSAAVGGAYLAPE